MINNKMIGIFKKHKYVSIVIIIVLIAGGYYWYSKSKSGSTAVQYKTAVAEKGTLTTSVSGSGNVIVDNSANVDPTITGTVANLSVSVGEKVEKGQFLFNIKNDDLSANVTKAHSSYLQSLASLETAKASKKDAKTNYDDASSSTKSSLKKKLEAAEISVTVAEENIKYAAQSYQNEKSNYADSRVTAPISGTVNAINIKNGDDLSKLSSGSSRQIPIIIGDLGTLKAQVQVNEVDIPNVVIGQKVMLTFSAIEGLSESGKVEKMDSLGTLTSGVVTFNVTIGFDTLDPRIKPEMSVSASIITDVKQNVVIVSSSAVKTKNGSSYVQALVNGSPENKTVKVGSSNNTETEIVSGISAGDNIVTQTITSGSSSATASTSSNRGGLGGFGH
ncbi:MAG: efflux RND transporter periplasmic adaptor subunit [Parcubacteria group bacterium]|jgi:macrolide-specific efflux system membrane fusion protein